MGPRAETPEGANLTRPGRAEGSLICPGCAHGLAQGKPLIPGHTGCPPHPVGLGWEVVDEKVKVLPAGACQWWQI